MAWYKRYGVPFQSRTGTQYVVFIWEKTNGSLVYLKGGPEPFVTQEDENEDIFTPVRTQTGYLRIIDETSDGSLLETLMPSNNLQKYVTLESGSWNSSFTTFTSSLTCWQGFLVSQAFTQPWDKQKKLIEFPVKSLLGALDDVLIPESKAGRFSRIALLIEYAFEAIEIAPTNICIINDINNNLSDFLQVFFYWSVFFTEETILNQADSYTQLVGISYKEAFEHIARLYGFTMRENMAQLYIAQYDNAYSSKIYAQWLSWNLLVNVAGGSSVSMQKTLLQDVSLLDNVTFKGSQNTAEFIQGRNTALVSLKIGGLSLKIRFPETAKYSDQPSDLSSRMRTGSLYVQAHSPRALAIETFKFSQYTYTTTQHSGGTWTDAYSRVGDSNYNSCLSDCAISRTVPPKPLTTGAFPCRWFFKSANDASLIILKNGLFLNQLPLQESLDTISASEKCYNISSALAFTMNNGYIHINMQQHSLIYEGTKLSFDTLSSYHFKTKLVCQLQVGNYYWNGSNWQTGQTSFTIPFTDTNIDTNKTGSINVDAYNGWFIPVSSEMSGIVTFSIRNYLYTATDFPTQHIYAWSRILSDLNIEFFRQNSMAADDRSENVYRQVILTDGFSGQEELNLKVGTINNNLIAPCFLMTNSSNYLETLTYTTGSSTTTARPEMRLLMRMVSQYGSIRRVFKGIFENGVTILSKRFTYLSKKFFGIDAKHNWRDDTQEVKFIEVS